MHRTLHVVSEALEKRGRGWGDVHWCIPGEEIWGLVQLWAKAPTSTELRSVQDCTACRCGFQDGTSRARSADAAAGTYRAGKGRCL